MLQSFRMRLFAAIVAGIICIPGFAFAQRPMPIENGILESDLNGNSFSITNLTNVTATGFFGDGAGLTNVTGTLPGNLVYTDVANQTIAGTIYIDNGTFTAEQYDATRSNYLRSDISSIIALATNTSGNSSSLEVSPGIVELRSTKAPNNSQSYWYSNGTIFNQATIGVTFATPNLSLSGANLTLDTGDAFFNGGNLEQVGNITTTASSMAFKATTNTANFNLFTSGTGDTYLNLYNNSTSQGSVFANLFGTLYMTGRTGANLSATSIDIKATSAGILTVASGGISLLDRLYVNQTVTASNLTIAGATSTPRVASIVCTSANTSLTFNSDLLGTGGATFFVVNSSPGNVTLVNANATATFNGATGNLTLGPRNSLMMIWDYASTNWSLIGLGDRLPPSVTLSSTAFSGNATWSGTNSFNGTTTIQSKFNLKQGINRDVDAVGNGTSTTQMSFVKITATGNFTVHDGATGDWITFKNYSGGAVTLLGTGGETFDGNAPPE